MWPTLEAKLAHFTALEEKLADPAIAMDPAKFSVVAKEHSALMKLIKPYLEYRKLDTSIQDSETLLKTESDSDMVAMIEEELTSLRPKREALREKLEDQLLVDPAEDFDSLIIEIRAGTGGDEAALFAGELYEMYTRYARTQRWSIDELSTSPGEAGGFKEVSFSIKGEGVYQSLRFGVGRAPGAAGAEDRNAGADSHVPCHGRRDAGTGRSASRNQTGGPDHRNDAGRGRGRAARQQDESAVRIWYKQGTPDQIEVKCQDGRSQHKNKDQAMRVLRSRVFEAQQQKLHRERAEMRRTLIGGGDRSERIRTYNYPDGRITDHRIGLSVYKLMEILGGNLDHLITPMKEHDKKERLAQVK